MNKTVIIGNLTRNPELRSAPGRDGQISVCDFTVAVNRRNGRSNSNGQQEADFFKVTVWRGLADVCAQYLAKGRKVAVVGPVSASAYMGNDGEPHAKLEITAEDVEFLTPKQEGANAQQAAPAGQRPAYQSAAAQPQYQQQQRIDERSGFVQVDEEELPF